jgi:hypothetical protein
VKRRQFITLFGSTAVAWPLAARAQQVRPLPRIGYLSVGFGGVGADAFREGLRDFGYVEGQNVLVEYRRAGEQGQLDALAAELVARKVEIIVCGGSQATRAALQQTKTIPIVTLSSNPVAVGFVASLANPGGNVTGVSLLGSGQAAAVAQTVDSKCRQGCSALESRRSDCALISRGNTGCRRNTGARPANSRNTQRRRHQRRNGVGIERWRRSGRSLADTAL